MESEKTSNKRRLTGVVTSNKMAKTVVVKVTRKQKHEKYPTFVEKAKKYFAHTENKYEIGDEVTIEESRPLSKNKRWVVVESTSDKKETHPGGPAKSKTKAAK